MHFTLKEFGSAAPQRQLVIVSPFLDATANAALILMLIHFNKVEFDDEHILVLTF